MKSPVVWNFSPTQGQNVIFYIGLKLTHFRTTWLNKKWNFIQPCFWYIKLSNLERHLENLPVLSLCVQEFCSTRHIHSLYVEQFSNRGPSWIVSLCTTVNVRHTNTPRSVRRHWYCWDRSVSACLYKGLTMLVHYFDKHTKRVLKGGD